MLFPFACQLSRGLVLLTDLLIKMKERKKKYVPEGDNLRVFNINETFWMSSNAVVSLLLTFIQYVNSLTLLCCTFIKH